MDLFNNILSSASGILAFIQNIPNMLIQYISNFPPTLSAILIAGLVIIIAIRILELLL